MICKHCRKNETRRNGKSPLCQQCWEKLAQKHFRVYIDDFIRYCREDELPNLIRCYGSVDKVEVLGGV